MLPSFFLFLKKKKLSTTTAAAGADLLGREEPHQKKLAFRE
jgi:hypothetical protein